MGKSRPNNGRSIARQKRLQQLTHDVLDGGYVSNHELASRHGISDSLLCQDLKLIRMMMEDETEEGAKFGKNKKIKQLEMNAARALRSYERSKQDHEETSTRHEKRTCTECKGKRELQKECEECEGRGWHHEELITRKVSGQAGDPRFLAEYRNCMTDICKLQGYYPEKKQTWEQYKGGVVAERSMIEGVSDDLVIKHHLLLLEMKESANGNGRVLNVESKENRDE